MVYCASSAARMVHLDTSHSMIAPGGTGWVSGDWGNLNHPNFTLRRESMGRPDPAASEGGMVREIPKVQAPATERTEAANEKITL